MRIILFVNGFMYFAFILLFILFFVLDEEVNKKQRFPRSRFFFFYQLDVNCANDDEDFSDAEIIAVIYKILFLVISFALIFGFWWYSVALIIQMQQKMSQSLSNDHKQQKSKHIIRVRKER